MTTMATVPATGWLGDEAQPVYVCSVGARTPVGAGWLPAAAAVRAGVSAIAAHPDWVDKSGGRVRVARDAFLDTDLDMTRRIVTMLKDAIDEAVPDRTMLRPGWRLECWVGIPAPRPGVAASLGNTVTVAVAGVLGVALETVHVLPYGHAAGAMAVQTAAQRVSQGHADLCLAAGADSYVGWDTLEWLDMAGRLMSAANRNGFPPGEGAAVCVVAGRRVAQALALALPELVRIAAAATAMEPQPALSCDQPCIGVGLTEAIRGAVTGTASLGAVAITYCDLNGERHRNEEFVYTMLRTQDAFADANDYVAPADCWGDAGAASGPLYVCLAVAAAQRGYGRGRLPLLWTASDAGQRCAVLLDVPLGEGRVR